MGVAVSAVIAVYDGERYIEAAARSVLAQTYDDLELIVVDDGSTDRTLDVLRAISDPRLRIIEQPNAGVAAAYNRGAAAARGEVLAFLDHDDEWFPHKLALQVPILLRSRGGAVGAVLQYAGPYGNAIPAFIGEPTDGRHDLIAAARFMPFARSSMVVLAEQFRELGGFDTFIDRHVGPVEDFDFVSRVAQRGLPVTLVPEVLGHYRVHPASVSARRFFAMQEATRFLVARASARGRGRDLSWIDYQLRRLPLWTRLRDRGHLYYRTAGICLATGERRRAVRYLAGATVLAPVHATRRLRRQANAAVRLRFLGSGPAQRGALGTSPHLTGDRPGALPPDVDVADAEPAA